jgi:hypothetical protein
MNKNIFLTSLYVASISLFLCIQNEALAATSENIKTERSLTSQWQWQYRVLAIYLPNLEQISQLRAYLEKEKVAIEQRRLKVIVLNEVSLVDVLENNSKVNTNSNQKEISEKMAGKSSILIGLDGGVKNFYDWPNAQTLIDLEAVFADIDGMPMRRMELSESRNPEQ